MNETDACFIAFAMEDVPKLVAEVIRLRKVIKEKSTDA